MQYFNKLSEAERYARSRPNFHPLAIEKAAPILGIQEKVPLALDIACGTGQSTLALLSISERVIGLDISWSMLANAQPDPQVVYLLSQAEAIPLKDASVPIVSCALAFHWFDRERFLRESWRVLKPGGLLIIYNNGFTGKMRENPAFLDWAQKTYQEHFPTPPRNSQPLTSEDAAGTGFTWIGEERYENEITFTPDQLVAYLITQTNVSAALRQGRETVESARQWLLDQVLPYFAQAKGGFVFSTKAWYFRKEA